MSKNSLIRFIKKNIYYLSPKNEVRPLAPQHRQKVVDFRTGKW